MSPSTVLLSVTSTSFFLSACGSDSASTDKTDSDKAKTTQQEEKDTKETKTDSQSNDKSNNDKNEKAENASKKDSSDKKTSENKKKLVDVTLNRTVDGDTIKVNYKGCRLIESLSLSLLYPFLLAALF